MKNNKSLWLTKSNFSTYAWTTADDILDNRRYTNLTRSTLHRISNLTYKPNIESRIVVINPMELTIIITNKKG